MSPALPTSPASPSSTPNALPGRPTNSARSSAQPRVTSYFALYRLAALTGMRRGELCGLRWEDVDFAEQTVRVRKALAMINGIPRVSTPKSRRSRRVIDIDDRTTDILRAHWDQQREAAEFVGDGWTETGYVFTTVIGTPQHPDNVSKRFVALVRTIEVSYLTLHGLRHTHATHLLAMGKNPRIGQRTPRPRRRRLHPPSLRPRPARPPTRSSGGGGGARRCRR